MSYWLIFGLILEKLDELSKCDGITIQSILFVFPSSPQGPIATTEFLKIADNQITGELPSAVASLSNLETLILANNQLGGRISESIGEMANLRTLLLEGNQFEGQIPTQLGKLTLLRELDLYGNELTGAVPIEICDLRDGELSRLETDCASGQVTCDCCTSCQ